MHKAVAETVCKKQNKQAMGCAAQLAWKWLFVHFFWKGILPSKVGQSNLVIEVYAQSSLVGLCVCVQDYKYLYT